jgi:arylsulfatase A-like enzyme
MTNRILFALLLLTSFGAAQPAGPRRNVIVFVADGLRHNSVDEHDTPALWSIRKKGVHFENSHSLIPTFTTANASAIATGHRLGDTGDYSNGLYTGYPIFDTGNFNHGPGTTIPFIENNEILADLNSHHGGNYLNEQTLLEAARLAGFNTAVIGKIGPAAIQAIHEIGAQGERFAAPETIVIDDATAYNPYDPNNLVPLSVPLPDALIQRMQKLNLALDAPSRSNGYPEKSPYNNGYAGGPGKPGTLRPNYLQQDWMLDVTTRAVLPMFVESNQPFVLLFWSRDPDATQHNQGDSLNQLVPGINGPSSVAAVRNADRALQALLDWLEHNPSVKSNTDIFVTSDHGFSTVSRRELDRTGAATKAQSAQHVYYTSNGDVDTPKGNLPSGFLAIDLAWSLQTKLWDPDSPSAPGSRSPYKQVKLAADEYFAPLDVWERPLHGNGFLGANVFKADGSDAIAVVAANGGSDLVYVPSQDPETVQRIVSALLKLDYVDGIFVDDRYGKIPGTLALSALDLVGSGVLPRPAIVVGFKAFYLNRGNVMQAAHISDTSLQEGQGNHGGFGREVTWNNMAALGPDFKSGYTDKAPVANSDIVPTLAKILGIAMSSNGKLQGRVIQEALAGQPDATPPAAKPEVSDPEPDTGLKTVLLTQQYGGQRYFDAACMTSAKTIDSDFCTQR